MCLCVLEVEREQSQRAGSLISNPGFSMSRRARMVPSDVSKGRHICLNELQYHHDHWRLKSSKVNCFILIFNNKHYL